MLIEYLNNDLTYEIIGKCYEVHNNLSPGFLEIVCKNALQYEFAESNIPFEREVKYNVNYKGIVLPHHFYADFVVFNSIILEVKAISAINDESIAQTINYLIVSENRIGLIVNFGEKSLKTKRLIY